MHINYAYNTIKNQYDFDAIKQSNMTNSTLENPATQTQEQSQVECYTKITNNLLDALMLANITLHQQTVMLAIIRKTFGFHKTVDRITNVQISKMTGIPVTRVCTAKNQLLARKILFTQGSCIGINTVITAWKSAQNKTEFNQKIPVQKHSKSTTFPKKGNVDNYEKLPEKGNETFPKTGKKTFPKKGNHKRKKETKENNNIYIQNFSLDLSCFKQQPTQSVWSDYLLHRKAKKAPLTQTALNRLASKINEANEKGYDTNDVLADCMLRNWQSFDVAWLENKRVVTSPAMQSKQELEAAWNDTKVVDDFIKSPAFAEALLVGERRRSMY